jgi:peptidoglycan/xylan/chitin deacetylase (PgdA/CDA1 family)
MKHSAKALVKELLLITRHYHERLARDTFGGVAVLCYHGIRHGTPNKDACFPDLHVTVKEFECHCRLLREACHPISLSQWKSSLNGGLPLPPRPVLVTFDDGYHSVFSLALPALQKYEIPAVVFVCSDPIENEDLFWYDAIAHSFGEAGVAAMAKLPYPEWRKACAKLVIKSSNEHPNAPLSVEDLKILAATPGIEIGGHTSTHPRLAMATKKEQLTEVLRNKEALERWTGRDMRAFAYPNGLPGQDYNSDSVSVVNEAGYEFGFTTVQSYAQPHDMSLEIPRFLMLAGVSPGELGHRFAYSWPRAEFESAS